MISSINKIKTSSLCLLTAFFFISGSLQQKHKKENDHPKKIAQALPLPAIDKHYNYETPDKTWQMPAELREISGICFNKEGKILCHQDQNGKIFIYDLQKAAIEKVIKFSGKGDFEDIAYNNDTVFVLRSDGVIFKVINYLSTNPTSITISTFLNQDNNCEGLFYDKDRNRLLIACKGNPGIAGAHKSTKAVYAVNLTDNKTQQAPVYTILKKELKAVFGGEVEIDPSAIAINPLTKNIFILGTRNEKVLIELLPNGTVLHVNKLTNPLFIQPEGIIFDRNGDMYISNEGKDREGNILLFKYKK